MPRGLPFRPTPSLTRILRTVGKNIRLARIRRQLTAKMVAERAGMTRVTFHKIEKGDPSVTFGAYANVLQALGLADDLALLARDDALGRALQDAGLDRKRVRPPRSVHATRDHDAG